MSDLVTITFVLPGIDHKVDSIAVFEQMMQWMLRDNIPSLEPEVIAYMEIKLGRIKRLVGEGGSNV